MPIITPDTSMVEDFSKPIEEGTYRARIVSVDVGRSKAGAAKIVPKFEIAVGDGKRRTRVAHLNVEGEGALGFDQLLRACHLQDLADEYRQGSKKPFDTDVLVGQELQVVIAQEVYKPEGGQEQLRDRITGFLPL